MFEKLFRAAFFRKDMKDPKNAPLVVSSIPNKGYENFLKDPSFGLRFAMAEEVIKNPPANVKVAFFRAGYENEFDLNVAVGAMKAENILRRAGARIINSVRSSRLGHRKDIIYGELKRVGISVPRFLPNPSITDILVAIEAGYLKYPFIYRLADASSGVGMFLISDISALKEVNGRFSRKEFAPFWRTMAVEFIEARQDGCFVKTRLYVIGNKVDMFRRTLNKSWIVANHQPELEALGREANARYKRSSKIDADAVKVGETLGLEIYAVDVLECDSGYFIIDVNSTYTFIYRETFFPPDLAAYRKSHPKRVSEYLRSL